MIRLKYSELSLYTYSQEIVDKTMVNELFDCNQNPDYVQDTCLNECLINISIQEFKCLHPRLAWNGFKSLKNQRICQFEDFNDKTQEYLSRVQLYDSSIKVVEEYGLVRLRQMLASFNQDVNTELRCGCQLPCRRKIPKIIKWPHEEATDPFANMTSRVVFYVSLMILAACSLIRYVPCF
jgi:hypothetical protein